MNILEIPVGWKQKKINELFEVVRGGSPRPKGDPRYFGGPIPWVKISDATLSKGKYLTTTKEGLKEAGVSKSRLIKSGFLILTNSATICLPKIMKIDGCIHDGFLSFSKLTNEIDIDFLYYYFLAYRKHITENIARGLAQKNLNTTLVGNLQINYPDIKIQKKIVKKLDYVTEKLDEKIEMILTIYNQQLKTTKKQRKIFYNAIIDNACFGNYTHNWRKNNPDSKLPSKILKHHDPSLNDKFENFILPKNWIVLPLDTISEIRSGVTLGRNLTGDLINLSYLRVANVQDGYFDLSLIKETPIKPEEQEKWILKKYDILLTEGGDWDKLGRGAVWENQINPCIHQNHIFRVRIIFPEIHPNYVSYLLSSSFGKNYFQNSAKRTTNLASINSTQLKAFPIICPSYSEQIKILEIIKERTKSIDELDLKMKQYDEFISKSKEYLNTISNRILQQAFDGKLLN